VVSVGGSPCAALLLARARGRSRAAEAFAPHDDGALRARPGVASGLGAGVRAEQGPRLAAGLPAHACARASVARPRAVVLCARQQAAAGRATGK
jgi:hypothetical protein